MAGPRNAFERRLNEQLKRSNVKFTYEKTRLPYQIDAWYLPDWVLENGIVLEAKGYIDRETKRKMTSVKKCYPDLDIRFILYDAYKKISGTKQLHWEWCEKNGFPWAHETIPESWLTNA